LRIGVTYGALAVIHRAFAAIAYVFAWASHFKLGYAACPWNRLARGWHDLHPPVLCGLLADPELLYALSLGGVPRDGS
jgi:hypothetical protein